MAEASRVILVLLGITANTSAAVCLVALHYIFLNVIVVVVAVSS